MSDIAIRVENLGKKYKIGANQARYQTLRESIVNGFSSSIERIKGAPPKDDNIIWALKDINFEVKHGEVLGIIGRNGAGKSTLLKILSRITKPTTGRFELNGRVGSLLEVGTGFHPELTGRENIYLSGAILGMKRNEINRKFDEIVDFAEIEKFLDTPVKHYSSGMYMRLAFSVAAHLEPEILLVDEVLAVGDAEFQKKCLGKMGDVAGEGRTVLFVSHNMGAIRNLCQKCFFISNGKKDMIDITESVIKRYLDNGQNEHPGIWVRNKKVDSDLSIIEISSRNELNQPVGNLDSNKKFKIQIKINVKNIPKNAEIHIRITNQEGITIFTLSNLDGENCKHEIISGISIYEVTITANFLKPGKYNTVVAILEPNIRIFDLVEDFNFNIIDIGNHGTILRDGRLGLITPIFEWIRIIE
jgi:lipopolysaccharide transport system ATP-binding protein